MEQAQKDKLEALGLASAVTGGITLFNYRFNAPGGPLVQKPLQTLLTGVSVTPQPTGRAAVKLPKVSILAAALPSPVGYVPAEFYGLPPDFYVRELGRPIGSKPLGFEATEARKTVYNATVEANRILTKLTGVPNGIPSQYDPRAGYTLPPGPLRISAAEVDFLKSLPPAFTVVQRYVPLIDQRQAEQAAKTTQPQKQIISVSPVPGGFSVVRATILNGVIDSASIQTEFITAVNQHAIDNELAAQGLRRELVSERADP